MTERAGGAGEAGRLSKRGKSGGSGIRIMQHRPDLPRCEQRLRLSGQAWGILGVVDFDRFHSHSSVSQTCLKARFPVSSGKIEKTRARRQGGLDQGAERPLIGARRCHTRKPAAACLRRRMIADCEYALVPQRSQQLRRRKPKGIGAGCDNSVMAQRRRPGTARQDEGNWADTGRVSKPRQPRRSVRRILMGAGDKDVHVSGVLKNVIGDARQQFTPGIGAETRGVGRDADEIHIMRFAAVGPQHKTVKFEAPRR